VLSFRLTTLASAALFAVALSLLPATSLKAQCPNRYVTTSTDRFSGATRTETPTKLDAFKPHDKLSTVILSQSNGGATRLSFIFIITSQNKAKLTSFIECKSVYILADDKIMETGPHVHGWREAQVNVTPGALVMSVFLSPNDLATFASATKLEFKVCVDEKLASPEFVQAAHEFACKALGLTQLPRPGHPNAAEAWSVCIKVISEATKEASAFPSYTPELLVKSATDATTDHFEFRASINIRTTYDAEKRQVIAGHKQDWTCSIDYENGVAKAPIVVATQ
jgi:hypothetical protein